MLGQDRESTLQCAILVVSCDKNIGVLNILFDSLEKNWCDCPFPIYLGMEKAQPQYKNVSVICSERSDFAGRLKTYIKEINCEYILLILDDFILEKTVDNNEILGYYELMLSNNKIACITLAKITAESECTSYDKILKRNKNANYLLNMQTGFWRSKILYDLLKNGENAWQTELYGSIRARKYHEWDFLNLSSDEYMPYVYNRGWLIVKGAWNGNEIKRLNLEGYSASYLDGKSILYSDFGRVSKIESVRLRVRVMLRKVLSMIRIYC